jgi:hypothetical protein
VKNKHGLKLTVEKFRINKIKILSKWSMQRDNSGKNTKFISIFF